MARDADNPKGAAEHLRDGHGRGLEIVSSAEVLPAASLTEDAHDEPLFGAQWHLDSPGGFDINIGNVWNDYTGAGVRVGVIDTGIDPTHPDLDDNIDSDSRLNSKTGSNSSTSGNPQTVTDDHGTAVAGVIAAEDNDIGVVGVAHGATLVSIYTPLTTSAFAQRGLLFSLTVDVVNNSWGYGGNFDPFYADFDDGVRRAGEDASFLAYGDAIRTAAELGRENLGTVIVFSAGNHALVGDDTNLSNFTNSRYAITVGAIQEDGARAEALQYDPFLDEELIAPFSTPGASLLVSAPGADIATTDRPGSAGFVPSPTHPVTLGSSDYVEVDGTSFSAPIVSGVAALMLEANSGLGARDVQEILAYSARTLDDTIDDWQTNGAANWNGGGLTWSHYVGSGLVDAHAAVRLAETWFIEDVFGLGGGAPHTFNNEATASGSAAPHVAIPDNSEVGVSSTITVTENILIDHIEVHLDINHTWIGDLAVELVGPSGLSAVLMVLPYRGLASENNVDFTFSSTFFWGETSAGDWTLNVYDFGPGDTGTLVDWQFTAYGDAISVDDTYFYTNAFGGTFADGDDARRTLSDGEGNDTINIAAVESDSSVDLTAGSAQIAGRTLTIAAGTEIENVIAGDGDDTLTGSAVTNLLHGGRGDDTLSGEGGFDLLMGGAGDDVLHGGSGDDMLAGGRGSDLLQGGDGNDAADYRDAGGAVSVDLDETGFQSVGADQGQDRLVSIEILSGGIFGDTLRAASSGSTLRGMAGDDLLIGRNGSNLLQGGDGDDTLDGGGGVDRLEGGIGNDIFLDGSGVFDGGAGDDVIGVFLEDGDEAIEAQQTDGVITVGDTVIQAQLVSVEGLVIDLAGGNDTVSLGSLDGADISFVSIVGGSGDDIVIGDAAGIAVRVHGGDGDDTLSGGSGEAVLSGGDGDDTLDFSRATGGLTVNLDLAGSQQGIGGGYGQAHLESIEAVLGGAFNDVISGDGAANTLSGGEGSDRIEGAGGDDTLMGEGGDDVLVGGGGADLLEGGQGSDILSGGDGVDTLRGGAGNDHLLLGDGLDSYDGGEGFDHLLMTGSGLVDLRALDTITTTTSLEVVDFSDDQDGVFVLDLVAVQALLGGAPVALVGDADDMAILEGAWLDQGTIEREGQTWRSYSLEGTDLLVSTGLGSLVVEQFEFSLPTVGSYPDVQVIREMTPDEGELLFVQPYSFSTNFGFSAGGDFNGDGYDDFFLHTYQSSYFVFGRADLDGLPASFNGLNGTDGFRITGSGSRAWVEGALLGDINGDGFDDFYWASYGTVAGQIVFGRSGPFNASYLSSGENTLSDVSFVNSDPASVSKLFYGEVAAAGDVNGDGFEDFVVGMKHVKAFDTKAGAAYIVFGHNGPWTDFDLGALDGSDGYRILGDESYRNVGGNVAGIGDINGDGFDDVLVSSPPDGVVGHDQDGNAYVIFGKAGGFDASISVGSLNGANGFKITGPSDRSNFATSVAAVGDFNGDGIDDYLVNATSIETSFGSDSAAYLVYGKTGGYTANFQIRSLDGTNGFKITHDYGGAFSHVTALGDINNDGLADIAVNAYQDKRLGYEHGAAIVIFGHAAGGPAAINASDLASGTGSTLLGDVKGERMGTVVSSVGDFNGDGVQDLLVTDNANASKTAFDTFIVWGQTPADDGSGFIFREGSAGSDLLNGLSGDDLIMGRDGDDTLGGGDGGNDILQGNGGGDRLSGGAGNDFLFGGSGNDTLSDGDGNDLLDGGDGDDVLVVRGTLVPSLAAEAFGAGGKPAGAETTVIGGEGDDTATITTYALDDTLSVTVLDGGSIAAVDENLNTVTLEDVEAVVIELLDGDDIITIGSMAGSALVSGTVLGGTGDDVVDAGAAGVTLSLGGGDGDDILIAGSASDQLDGSLGNDTLMGGAGNDSLDGGDGNDDLHGGDGQDLLSGGAGEDVLDGEDSADTLQGGAGNDVLSGSAGDDSLDGDAGADALSGGAGDDTLAGGAGVDRLHGGEGSDWVTFGEAVGPVRVVLHAGYSNGEGLDRDRLMAIENAAGSLHDDLVIGDDGANILLGLDGDDVLAGYGGSDDLAGGAGDDWLRGQDGDDVLAGGSGHDTLEGGVGNDVFVFTTGDGLDTVADFQVGADFIDISSLAAITDFVDLTANHMAQLGADLLIESGSGDQIVLVGVYVGDLSESTFLF
jgi:Ca2+-binding RTX toxin-like protein